MIAPRVGRSPTRVPNAPARNAGTQAEGEPCTGCLGAALQMVRAELLADAALQSAVCNGGTGLDQHAAADGDLSGDPRADDDQWDLGCRVEGQGGEHDGPGSPAPLQGSPQDGTEEPADPADPHDDAEHSGTPVQFTQKVQRPEC